MKTIHTLDHGIPGLTVIGNPVPGDGPAQPIPLAVHAANLVATGVVASAGTPANLTQVADGYVLANTSGTTAAPIGTGLSALLDHDLGAVQGDVLYRSATVWSVLAPGTAGQFLMTGGAAANPSWVAVGGTTPAVSGMLPLVTGELYFGMPVAIHDEIGQYIGVAL